MHLGTGCTVTHCWSQWTKECSTSQARSSFIMLSFIILGDIAILRRNLPKFLILDQDRQLQISHLRLTNLTFSECQISWHSEYVSFLKPNFPWILVLMWNVCCLAVILIFLVVTAHYLVITAGYLVVTVSYYSLVVVTACYCSRLPIPTFSMNAKRCWCLWPLYLKFFLSFGLVLNVPVEVVLISCVLFESINFVCLFNQFLLVLKCLDASMVLGFFYTLSVVV